MNKQSPSKLSSLAHKRLSTCLILILGCFGMVFYPYGKAAANSGKTITLTPPTDKLSELKSLCPTFAALTTQAEINKAGSYCRALQAYLTSQMNQESGCSDAQQKETETRNKLYNACIDAKVNTKTALSTSDTSSSEDHAKIRPARLVNKHTKYLNGRQSETLTLCEENAKYCSLQSIPVPGGYGSDGNLSQNNALSGMIGNNSTDPLAPLANLLNSSDASSGGASRLEKKCPALFMGKYQDYERAYKSAKSDFQDYQDKFNTLTMQIDKKNAQAQQDQLNIAKKAQTLQNKQQDILQQIAKLQTKAGADARKALLQLQQEQDKVQKQLADLQAKKNKAQEAFQAKADKLRKQCLKQFYASQSAGNSAQTDASQQTAPNSAFPQSEFQGSYADMLGYQRATTTTIPMAYLKICMSGPMYVDQMREYIQARLDAEAAINQDVIQLNKQQQEIQAAYQEAQTEAAANQKLNMNAIATQMSQIQQQIQMLQTEKQQKAAADAKMLSDLNTQLQQVSQEKDDAYKQMISNKDGMKLAQAAGDMGSSSGQSGGPSGLEKVMEADTAYKSAYEHNHQCRSAGGTASDSEGQPSIN